MERRHAVQLRKQQRGEEAKRAKGEGAPTSDAPLAPEPEGERLEEAAAAQ
jgi:hypothetical protein